MLKPATGGDTSHLHRLNIERARSYDAELAAAGRPYPSSSARPDQVWMKQVAKESGIPYEVLAHDTSIRRFVLGRVAHRGLKPYIRPRLSRDHSLADLRALCELRLVEERSNER